MKENDVLEIVKKELAVDTLEMDAEGQWDSLDIITVLMALDVAFDGKLREVRELETVKTPRNMVDILKTRGFIE